MNCWGLLGFVGVLYGVSMVWKGLVVMEGTILNINILNIKSIYQN